ncbi:MAG: ATP synthase F1 subunit epsilon [Planctomycetota bacterium]|nr:MAG: ATP synthase F1 subunit epsilon [Planctomycetota bacterium]
MAESTSPNGMLKLSIITPEKTVFSGTAKSLQYPGEDGLYGILPGHAAMITTVAPGPLYISGTSDGEMAFALMGGFAEVKDNEVRFVVDAAELKGDIDSERAKAAAERARERLKKQQSDKIDTLRADRALKRALVRLQMASKR